MQIIYILIFCISKTPGISRQASVMMVCSDPNLCARCFRQSKTSKRKPLIYPQFLSIKYNMSPETYLGQFSYYLKREPILKTSTKAWNQQYNLVTFLWVVLTQYNSKALDNRPWAKHMLISSHQMLIQNLHRFKNDLLYVNFVTVKFECACIWILWIAI